MRARIEIYHFPNQEFGGFSLMDRGGEILMRSPAILAPRWKIKRAALHAKRLMATAEIEEKK